ncbi:MAG: P-type conjugative transfer protein TrbL [Desulfovibrionaceae bacterium]|nr:P-type conjugative transfer protein TrbL [Desulfovibrionaceae bacterium]
MNPTRSKRTLRIVIASFSVVICFVIFLPFISHSANTPDVFDRIVSDFDTVSTSWGSTLQDEAFKLFRLCLILSIVMFGVKAALNRTGLGEIMSQFIMMLLFSCFIAAVIHYYQEWAWNLISGLSNLSDKLNASKTNAKTPMAVGLAIVSLILDKISVWSPGESIAFVVCGLVILVSFALITAQMVFIKCEAMIAMNASVILLGFGGADFLKNYAINVMRYVLSVAFKLFVLQLLLNIGMTFITGVANTTEAKLEDFFVTIGVSIVLLALVKSIPDVCAGIINGSHVSSGAVLGQAAASVATGAAATMAGAYFGTKGGVQASSAVRTAAQMANMDGKTGLGKMAHMASNLYSANKEASAEGARQRHFAKFGNTMNKRFEEMKMGKMGGDSGGSGSDGGSSG